LHRLGTNYYDAEELSMGEKKMQESAAVWRTVSSGLQLNFANCMQDVFNTIAIVRANREDSKEALTYLEQSLSVYNNAIDACKRVGGNETVLDAELTPIDRFLLRPTAESAETFERRIFGGINVRVLETNLTQTYFYCAQVYQMSS
jgi:hypothetical protein